MPDLRSGAASDTGLLRERNEDRYWMDADRGIFLVVDGVGGHAGGELAAQTAVEAIRESMTDSSCSDAGAERRVRQAITSANNRILSLAAQNPELAGMAGLLWLWWKTDALLGHVGDSRCYLIPNGAIASSL